MKLFEKNENIMDLYKELGKTILEFKLRKLGLAEHGNIGKDTYTVAKVWDLVLSKSIERDPNIFYFNKKLSYNEATAELNKILSITKIDARIYFLIITPSRAYPNDPSKSHSVLVAYDRKKPSVLIQDSMLTEKETKEDKTINDFTNAIITIEKKEIEIIYRDEIQQYPGEIDCLMWSYVNLIHLNKGKELIDRHDKEDFKWAETHYEILKHIYFNVIKDDILTPLKEKFLEIKNELDGSLFNFVAPIIIKKMIGQLRENSQVHPRDIMLDFITKWDPKYFCASVKIMNSRALPEINKEMLFGLPYFYKKLENSSHMLEPENATTILKLLEDIKKAHFFHANRIKNLTNELIKKFDESDLKLSFTSQSF